MRQRKQRPNHYFALANLWIWHIRYQPIFCLISTKEWHPAGRDHHFYEVKLFSLHCTSVHSPLPLSLWPPHPQIFWLITPNVILIKNGGVKGFSLPEKRVQIAAQWQTLSLAWEEMHPDIVSMMPSDQSQIKKKRFGPMQVNNFYAVIRNKCKCEYMIIVSVNILSDFFKHPFFHALTTKKRLFDLSQYFDRVIFISYWGWENLATCTSAFLFKDGL